MKKTAPLKIARVRQPNFLLSEVRAFKDVAAHNNVPFRFADPNRQMHNIGASRQHLVDAQDWLLLPCDNPLHEPCG
jgi:hypothetical protein